jgi:arginine/ornithine N-succinyltransferase beta subunit
VTGFRDKDPEDVYDAGDPLAVRVDVIERVVNSLRGRRDQRTDARRDDMLRVVLVLLDELRYHRRRVDRLRNDLEEL